MEWSGYSVHDAAGTVSVGADGLYVAADKAGVFRYSLDDHTLVQSWAVPSSVRFSGGPVPLGRSMIVPSYIGQSSRTRLTVLRNAVGDEESVLDVVRGSHLDLKDAFTVLPGPSNRHALCVDKTASTVHIVQLEQDGTTLKDVHSTSFDVADNAGAVLCSSSSTDGLHFDAIVASADRKSLAVHHLGWSKQDAVAEESKNVIHIDLHGEVVHAAAVHNITRHVGVLTGSAGGFSLSVYEPNSSKPMFTRNVTVSDDHEICGIEWLENEAQYLAVLTLCSSTSRVQMHVIDVVFGELHGSCGLPGLSSASVAPTPKKSKKQRSATSTLDKSSIRTLRVPLAHGSGIHVGEVVVSCSNGVSAGRATVTKISLRNVLLTQLRKEFMRNRSGDQAGGEGAEETPVLVVTKASGDMEDDGEANAAGVVISGDAVDEALQNAQEVAESGIDWSTMSDPDLSKLEESVRALLKSVKKELSKKTKASTKVKNVKDELKEASAALVNAVKGNKHWRGSVSVQQLVKEFMEAATSLLEVSIEVDRTPSKTKSAKPPRSVAQWLKSSGLKALFRARRSGILVLFEDCLPSLSLLLELGLHHPGVEDAVTYILLHVQSVPADFLLGTILNAVLSASQDHSHRVSDSFVDAMTGCSWVRVDVLRYLRRGLSESEVLFFFARLTNRLTTLLNTRPEESFAQNEASDSHAIEPNYEAPLRWTVKFLTMLMEVHFTTLVMSPEGHKSIACLRFVSQQQTDHVMDLIEVEHQLELLRTSSSAAARVLAQTRHKDSSYVVEVMRI